MFKNKKASTLMASPYMTWSLVFIIVPLGMILFYGFTNESSAFTLRNILAIADKANFKALVLAVTMAIISTIICLARCCAATRAASRG